MMTRYLNKTSSTNIEGTNWALVSWLQPNPAPGAADIFGVKEQMKATHVSLHYSAFQADENNKYVNVLQKKMIRLITKFT